MRNSTLDLFKFIACFLVVFIHSELSFEGHSYLLLLCRAAVPFFFMITGFYYPGIIARQKEKAYFKRILNLVWLPVILYALLVFKMLPDLTMKDFWYWAGLNVMPFGGHLWYLFALLYVLVIVGLVKPLIYSKKALYGSIFLISVNYLLSFQEDIFLYRNFLFTGLPYFLLGSYLYQKKEVIADSGLSTGKFLAVLIGLMGALALEYRLYGAMNLLAERDHYLMLYPLCGWIFCYAIRRPDRGGELSSLGQKYCTSVYVYHLMVIMVSDRVVMLLGNPEVFMAVRRTVIYPLLVLVITMFMVAVFRYGKALVKRMFS